ncbi:hypothetical protein WICPIJ_001885 [Wickerhamomyces pijperi]|uniref:Uncharacterized protein n=1 Tax=Wickerhamomyces pijperi TaxID=599730 RepID=A0A9P8QCQ8_WICPI|nr:hypothetical protein WICPIJ_001885 [Wickerhamomyces pijperi]
MSDLYSTPKKQTVEQHSPQRVYKQTHNNSQISLLNMDKTYYSSDGQILQSSMVKAGSPTKRQLTGSASQVRFSLPPMSDDEESIMSEFEDEDIQVSEENKEDADTDQIEQESSPFLETVSTPTKSHHRSTSSTMSFQLTDTDTYSDNMRVLVQTSPKRGKILLNPQQHHIKSLSVPIPAEVMLPPRLSPKKRQVSGPKSMIFNGIDYEPFEKRFLDDTNYPRREFTALIATNKPVLSDFKPSNVILQPSQTSAAKSAPPSPVRRPQHRRTKSELINIPRPEDLLQFQVGFGKVEENERIDNEFEIENPSEKAVVLNNELNRKFSFPPRSSVKQNKEEEEEETTEPALEKPESPALLSPVDKDLPSLPLPQHTPVKQKLPTQGLGLFLDADLLGSTGNESTSNKFGRFSQIRTPEETVLQGLEEIESLTKDVEELLNQQDQPQIEQPTIEESNPDESYLTESDISQKSISITSIKSTKSLELSADIDNEMSMDDSFSSMTSRVVPFSLEQDDTSSNYTLEESKEVITIDDTVNEDEEDSYMSESSYDLSLTSQLQNLSLVLTNNQQGSGISEQGLLLLEKSIGSPSSLFHPVILDSEADEAEDEDITSEIELDETENFSIEELESLPLLPAASKPVKSISSQSPALSYYPEPEKVYEEDRLAVNIKSTSRDSPLLSQTSYETAESRPFSRCSADTDVTSFTQQQQQTQVMIDLTNDNYNVTYIKDPKYNGNIDSYKSVFERMDNGEIKETIILDDEEEEEEEERHQENRLRPAASTSPSLISAAGSHFSFCTVASEVQLHTNTAILGTPPRHVRTSQIPTTRYVSPNGKNVYELCDDTMNTSTDVLTLLQRQGSITKVNNSKSGLDPGVERFDLVNIENIIEEGVA